MKERIGLFLRVFAPFFLSACSTIQANPYLNAQAPPETSSASKVDVLYSPPQRPYISVGTVSAKRYKPGWSDPTVSDAIPELREAAAQIGADAVIVRSTVPGHGTRFITVEGEAIRYSVQADGVRPADLYDQLAKLKGLLDSGAITREEFDREKTRLLSK